MVNNERKVTHGEKRAVKEVEGVEDDKRKRLERKNRYEDARRKKNGWREGQQEESEENGRLYIRWILLDTNLVASVEGKKKKRLWRKEKDGEKRKSARVEREEEGGDQAKGKGEKRVMKNQKADKER